MNVSISKVINRKETMSIQNATRYDFIGLSTADKPTPANSYRVTTGSTFYEADTSKLFIFCGDTWYEKTSNVLTNLERHLKW